MGITKHRREWFIVLSVAAIAAIALLSPSPGQQAQAYEDGASTVTVNVSPGTVDVGEILTLDVDWVSDTDGPDTWGHHHGFWTWCVGDHWIVVDWGDLSSDKTDPLPCLGDPASDFFTHSYGSPGTYEVCATV